MNALQTLVLLACITHAPCHTQQPSAETQIARPEGLLSGLGRLVQNFLLDFGSHAAHLVLNGLPGGEGLQEAAGEEHAACGRNSARVYCLSVDIADFKEHRLQAQSLGSTCAPTGVWQAQDNLHADYCRGRYPTSKGTYISDEPCTLAPGAVCA